MTEFAYSADGDTVRAFFMSDAFVRLLRGPVGSGKSVACCIEIFRRACEQKKSPIDGLRKTRWAIIRNTQPELKTTTMKTWADWFPEEKYGKINMSPPFTHRIRVADIDCEVIFIALDKPEDVKKLLSLELTGGFINEAREVAKAIVDGLTMRVGRFPSKRDGGPTWSGVICDTNSPDEDHWWAIMSGDRPPPDYMTDEEIRQLVKPPDWQFFTQPPAMLPVLDDEGNTKGYRINPDRENSKALDTSYYEKMIAGKTPAWINVYVLNRYGSLTEGKPIYPGFRKDIHVTREPILPFHGHDIFVGVDFGLTPAAVFAQRVRDRWFVLHEVVAQDMGAVRFSKQLRYAMAEIGKLQEVPSKFSIWGDPAGDERAQTDEQTPFRIFRQAGIRIRSAPSNDIALRIEAVTATINRMIDGNPGLLVDPGCQNLITGFESGYHYRRLNVSGGDRYEEKPDKNRFSHVHDALQYCFLGGGEGRLLTSGEGERSVVRRPAGWNVFGRKEKARPRSILKNW